MLFSFDIFTKILANESPEPDSWVIGFGFKIEDNAGTGITQNERVVGLTFFTNTEGSPIESQVTLMIERVSEVTYKWELRRGPHQDDTLIASSDNSWIRRESLTVIFFSDPLPFMIAEMSFTSFTV